MGDLPADAAVNGGAGFKINPTLIDSTSIRKLEAFAYGSGGLGDVWRCSMSTPSGIIIVAVKCIRIPKADDEELKYKIGTRIRREAYVWITLSHDHILPFLGITETDDFGPLPALVSPWMENKSLNDYLKREFPQLSDDRKLELIQQVATGLCYLHKERKIVHGDLTGTNVLVDESGKICFADFGLSMVLAEAENKTFSSMHPGNARWMAPEFVSLPEDLEDCEEDSEIQLPPQKPTKEGDIYSFGCVMLQILSGKEPYARFPNVEHVIGAIIARRAPFIAIHINMNDSHRQLSSDCLSRKPEGRPSITKITTTLGLVVGVALKKL